MRRYLTGKRGYKKGGLRRARDKKVKEKMWSGSIEVASTLTKNIKLVLPHLGLLKHHPHC